MTGPGLQLFPPPPRAPRQTSPNRKPPRVKPPTPEPAAAAAAAADSMDSAKSSGPPADFHELIIQVNSVPVSPATSIAAPPPVAAPPRIHIPNERPNRTPPQEIRPMYPPPPPPRAREAPPSVERKPSRRVQDLRTGSPAYGSPDQNRTASPAFSTSPTLVRSNSAATQVRNASPSPIVPIRSMFPVYDPTVPLTQQAYKPTQPSPTHIPKTQISRSPYSPEFYVPHSHVAGNATTSPPPKPFFTPSHYLDNLWLATNGQEAPAVQIYTLRMHRATAANPTITFGTTPSLPFYSLGQSNLAGDQEVQSIMNQLLIQRHHPTQPRVLPVTQLDLIAPPSMDVNAHDPHQQDSRALLTSIFPKLAALAALDTAANSPAASHIAMADPGANSPAAQRLAEDVIAGAAQRECCALAWTRDPPEQQTNPWAKHLPSEGSYQLHHPTLGTFPIQMEGDCSVINAPSTRPQTAIYGHNTPQAPQQQQKPASITLLNPYILSPTSPRAANGFSSPLQPPPRLDSLQRPVSITPSEMSVTQLPTRTDASPEDAVLARLDFANDALTLNIGALSRFGNPFLVDVAASSLFAVAVAEASRGRGRGSRNASTTTFDAPPPSFALSGKKDSTAREFKEDFVRGFEGWGGRAKAPEVPGVLAGLKKFVGRNHGGHRGASKSVSPSGSSEENYGGFDKDIELGEWPASKKQQQQPWSRAAEVEVSPQEGGKKSRRRKKEQEEEQENLPFVTRSIISVLTFAFRAVVWVLRIAVKVVAGVVVMITRNFGKL